MAWEMLKNPTLDGTIQYRHIRDASAGVWHVRLDEDGQPVEVVAHEPDPGRYQPSIYSVEAVTDPARFVRA